MDAESTDRDDGQGDAATSPGDPHSSPQAVADLASALQVAFARAAIIRRHLQSTTGELALLEASLGRAVSALRELQTEQEADRDHSPPRQP